MGSAIEQHQHRVLQEKKIEINTSLLKMTENFITETASFENIVAEILVYPQPFCQYILTFLITITFLSIRRKRLSVHSEEHCIF